MENKRRNFIKLIRTIAVFAIVSISLFFLYNNIIKDFIKNLGNKNIEWSLELDPQAHSAFISLENGFVEYTKTVVNFYNLKAELLWSNNITMENPTHSFKNNHFIIHEHMGKKARVYSEEGLVYEINSKDPISFLSLNNNAYSIVITASEQSKDLTIYNEKGDKKSGYVYELDNIYPFSAAISDDNESYLVNLVNTQEGQIKSSVSLYNISDAKLISSFDLNDSLLLGSVFANENLIISLSDNKVLGLSSKSKDSVFELELSNKIEKYAVIEGAGFVIYYGESFPNSEEDRKAELVFYDLKAKEVKSLKVDKTITFLYTNLFGVIAGFENDFYGFDKSSREIWHHKSTKELEYLLPIGTIDSLLRVSKIEADIISISDINNEIEKPSSPSGDKSNLTIDESSEIETSSELGSIDESHESESDES